MFVLVLRCRSWFPGNHRKCRANKQQARIAVVFCPSSVLFCLKATVLLIPIQSIPRDPFQCARTTNTFRPCHLRRVCGRTGATPKPLPLSRPPTSLNTLQAHRWGILVGTGATAESAAEILFGADTAATHAASQIRSHEIPSKKVCSMQHEAIPDIPQSFLPPANSLGVTPPPQPDSKRAICALVAASGQRRRHEFLRFDFRRSYFGPRRHKNRPSTQ